MRTLSRNSSSRRRRRGGVLLAVLWLTAALSAIAFSLATTVRVETERSATLADSVRAQYLAAGAVERAILFMEAERDTGRVSNRIPMAFPTGMAAVEIIPETSRLGLNTARAEDFRRLLLALGAEPMRAQEIAAALEDWRRPGGGFDAYYSSLIPSFRARHASFQEVDEAIWLRGMTPELFHGAYTRDPRTGRLVRTGAFKDCVSVYGAADKFDASGAEPALLAALGVPWDNIPRLLAERESRPLRVMADMGRIAGMLGGAGGRLIIGGNTIYTFRATARARRPDGRLSEVSRTVSAQVKFRKPEEPPPYQVLRWSEQAFSSAYSESVAWR